MPDFLGTGLVALVCVTLLTLLLFQFRAFREGSFRRGQGWYLDVQDRPKTWSVSAAPVRPGMRLSLVRLSLGVGLGAVALAVLLWWPLDIPVLSVVTGVLALAVLGAAWEGWRENRFLRGPAGGAGGVGEQERQAELVVTRVAHDLSATLGWTPDRATEAVKAFRPEMLSLDMESHARARWLGERCQAYVRESLGSTPWPACPWHEAHALALQVQRDGDIVWVCPETEVVAGALGSLAAVR